VSQSPSSAAPLAADADYFRSWDALGLMIARGSSFSGRERNCVFLNTGSRRFADVSAASRLDLVDDGRAVALTDWDQDGDLDLWFANRTAPRLRLLRNDLPSPGRSLAVRLEGRDCNRDAIGTRVEVHLDGQQPRCQVETLRAGDGFLTQSTKWLYFGLGSHTGPVRLRVRWPGESEWEEFVNLRPGRRYKIVQGLQKVHRLPAIRPNRTLLPSPPRLARASDKARVVLTHPVELSPVQHTDFEQNATALPTDDNRPLLLTLWASWCLPCLDELRGFAQHRERLDAAGLRILALSTDALDDAGDPAAAQRFVHAAKLTFDSGLATPELIRQLMAVHGRVFYKERAFPLPCSFLLDSQRRCLAIYRGGVTAEQVAADVALLDAKQPVRDAQAFPAPGHFFYRGPGVNSLAIVDAYREGGYLQDAHRELRELLLRIRENAEAIVPGDATAKALADVYSRLADLEAQLGNRQAATANWREATRLDAESVTLRVGLAIALSRQDNTREASHILQKVVDAAPDSADTWHVVGKAATQMGNPQRAAELLTKARSLSPDSAAIHLDLAMAWQLSGNADAAAQEYTSLLRRDPDVAQAANNLAWLYATDSRSEHRDGARAVELARHACRLTQDENPLYLGTLGSAYAEAGRFEDALAVTRRATELARQMGQTRLVGSLQQRLSLYEAKRPFHQSVAEPGQPVRP
jgi:tetratricopeptide (TPR) repeat protein